jgi:hypothetical protein
MYGTEKQITWANKIKEEKLNVVKIRMDETFPTLSEKAIFNLDRIQEAKFWINNRSCHPLLLGVWSIWKSDNTIIDYKNNTYKIKTFISNTIYDGKELTNNLSSDICFVKFFTLKTRRDLEALVDAIMHIVVRANLDYNDVPDIKLEVFRNDEILYTREILESTKEILIPIKQGLDSGWANDIINSKLWMIKFDAGTIKTFHVREIV